MEMMIRSNIIEGIVEGGIKRLGEAIFEEKMADNILKLIKNMNPSPSFFPTQCRYLVLGQTTPCLPWGKRGEVYPKHQPHGDKAVQA